MLKFDYEKTLRTLKEKFTIEQLKEIAFAFDSENADIKKVLSNFDDIINYSEFKEFFIESKIKEFSEWIETDIDYRKSEEYCGNYFLEMDYSELSVNREEMQETESGNKYWTNKFHMDIEKQENLLRKIANNFYCSGMDLLEYMEFYYYDMGSPFYNVSEQIYFQIANLGEIEIQLPEEIIDLLNNDDIGEEFKNQLENETYISISDNNEYAHYNVSYDSAVYGISYNDFISNIFENYDIEDMREEDKKDIKKFVEMIGNDEFLPAVMEIVNIL